MASGVYNRAKANLMNALMDMGTGGDTIKVLLLDSSHSFDADDDVLADVSANEVETSGTGYEQKTLANQSVTQDDANDVAKFDANNLSWTSASFTARHAVIYDDTIGTDDLICSIDFGDDEVVLNGTFQINWSSSGIIQLA